MKIHIPHVIIALIFFMFSGIVNAQKSNYLSYIGEHLIAPDNKIIVINLWSTKYPNEISKLNELTEHYKNENVVFLAISDEDKNEVDSFLKNNTFNYEHLDRVRGEKIFNQFQTRMFKVFPMHIIIDQNGMVTYKKKNRIKNIEKKLAKNIELLLMKNTNNRLQKSKYEYTMNKNFNNK